MGAGGLLVAGEEQSDEVVVDHRHGGGRVGADDDRPAAAFALQGGAQGVEEGDGAEVVDRGDGGRVGEVRADARHGGDAVQGPAAEPQDLVGGVAASAGGAEVGGDVGVPQVDADDPVSGIPQPGRAGGSHARGASGDRVRTHGRAPCLAADRCGGARSATLPPLSKHNPITD
ncbi:hypothetical protein [Streptomyces sp. A10(2020)]|uniref:hypothetical protein n=1 Tax=Streptomyces sp. A10(2020) TaxID=2782013 RepID=UPI001F5C4C4E|nr:hypothetical protein [Streptomyces sp. A10(2020)]